MEKSVKTVKMNELVEYKGKLWLRRDYIKNLKKYMLVAWDHTSEEKYINGSTIVKLI